MLEGSEYVRLTLLQLRVGCLILSPDCVGGGTFFSVKKAGGRQRVVWHGARVIEAAAAPPVPRHLASPCFFGFIDLAHGERVWVTRRDWHTWLDQLVLPKKLRPYMAHPRVSKAELVDAGASELDILSFLTTPDFSACASWFFVGQKLANGFLLELCLRAGNPAGHR